MLSWNISCVPPCARPLRQLHSVSAAGNVLPAVRCKISRWQLPGARVRYGAITVRFVSDAIIFARSTPFNMAKPRAIKGIIGSSRTRIFRAGSNIISASIQQKSLPRAPSDRSKWALQSHSCGRANKGRFHGCPSPSRSFYP